MTLEIGTGCFLRGDTEYLERIYGVVQLATLLVVLSGRDQAHVSGSVESELRAIGCELDPKSVTRALNALVDKGLLIYEDADRNAFSIRPDIILRGDTELLQKAILRLNGNRLSPDLDRLTMRAGSFLVPWENSIRPVPESKKVDLAAHYMWLRESMEEAPYLHEKGRVLDFFVELRAAEVDSGSALTADGYLDYSALLGRAISVFELLESWKGQTVIVQGNPGAGKSTIARAYVLHLHDYGEDGLFVPLLALAQPVDLQPQSAPEAFSTYLATNHIELPLERMRGITVVLDGLDEVSIRDEDDQRWTLALVDMGMRFAREHGASVVFTGRHEVVHFICSRVPNLVRFELLPMYVPYSRDLKQVDPDALVHHNEDLRVLWWRNFSSVYGIQDSFPKIFDSGALEHLSCEPLMLTMLAAMWLTTPDISAFKSKLEIFDAATTLVLSREYDRKQISSPLVETGLLGDYDAVSFRKLLMICGYSAWPNGGRVAALREVERLSAAQGLANQYRILIKSAEMGRPSALLFFYFRTSDLTKLDDGKVEFTHKSFSDYYAVRYLIDALQEITAQSVSFTRWVEVFGVADITSAHFEFFEEAFSSTTSEAKEILEKLSHLWHTWSQVELSALTVDVSHVDPQMLVNRARRAARNLASLILALITGAGDARTSQSRWPGAADALVDLLRTPASGDHVRRILKHTWFSQTSFEGANLSYTTLACCHIHGCNLTDSWLMHTSFVDGQIEQSDFARASGRSSAWTRATISHCQFGDAQLSRAEFFGAKILNTNMMGADLRDAAFQQSTLTNVSFFGADLRGVSLEGAVIGAVDFDQAKADPEMLDEEVQSSGRTTTLSQLGWSLVDGLLYSERQ